MQEQRLVKFIASKAQDLLCQRDIVIVGIDGPTASGKTILANNLGQELLTKNIHVDYYRLDWQLKTRLDRLEDLKIIKSSNKDFILEGEMHMHLELFHQFLDEIRLHDGEKQLDGNEYRLEVNKLYSRQDNGKRSGTHEFVIKFGYVSLEFEQKERELHCPLP